MGEDASKPHRVQVVKRAVWSLRVPPAPSHAVKFFNLRWVDVGFDHMPLDAGLCAACYFTCDGVRWGRVGRLVQTWSP